MVSRHNRRLRVEKLEQRAMLSGLPQQLVVMSENLYMGADPVEVIAASLTGAPALAIPAVTKFWSDVQKTNYNERADAIAQQIVGNKPDLVGLQEVMKYFSGSPDSLWGNPQKANQVELDFLQILLAKLAAKGVQYKPVSVTQLSEFEAPGYVQNKLQDIRLIDQVVILARSNLPASQVQFSNAMGGPFAVNLTLPKLVGDPLTIHRGWNSIDVKWDNTQFRFINMCLETPVFPLIQAVQGLELLVKPAFTSLPVVLVGDSNSNGSKPGAPNSFTYSMLVGSGLQDAWTNTHPGDPGYTWGNQPDLKNASSMSYHPLFTEPHRMDLVLHRGPFQATSMKRLGVSNAERTKSGMWPSDHAGVVATLKITQPAVTQAAAGFQTTSWAAPDFLTSKIASAPVPQLAVQTTSLRVDMRANTLNHPESLSTLINTLEAGTAEKGGLGFEWVSIAAADVAEQLTALLQSHTTVSLDFRTIGELDRVSSQSSVSLPPLDVSGLR